MQRSTLVALAVFAISACKSGSNKAGDSDLNFSKDALKAVEDIKFNKDQTDAMCAVNSLIVFIGNGEKMGAAAVFPKKGAGTLTDAAIKKFNDDEDKNHVEFVKSIEMAMADLKQQLGAKSCDAGEGTMTLATIFDGPGTDDSRIEVTEFGRKGTVNTDESTALVWKDKTLEKKDDVKFELNMAKDVPAILKAIRDRKTGDKAYGQITYYLKSHGAAFKKSVGTGHALLFDTNGPEGKLTSNLWFKVWSSAAVESLCPLPVAKTNTNYKFCVAMRSEYQTISGTGTDPTSGAGTDPTSGAGTDPTSGAGNDPTSGAGTDPTSGTTSTDPTTGTGTDPTTGTTSTDPTTGRSTVEMGDAEASYKFTADADPKTAQGYIMLGEAASYTLKEAPAELKGVKPLIFPVAKKSAAGGVRQPALIVFDSCQMSNNLDNGTLVAQNDGVSGIGGLGGSSAVLALAAEKVDQPVITIANPFPLYYFAVNYGLFSAKNYKSLPYILYWGLPTGKDKDGKDTYHNLATDSVKKGVKALVTAIGSTGLDKDRIIAHHTDPNPEERKKVRQQYSRLLPQLSTQAVAAQDD